MSIASRFIAFEGLDGAGTTTQSERLVAGLRQHGIEAMFTFEPSDRPVGTLIRGVLKGWEGALPSEALPWLFAADRADHLHSVILPALRAGVWVVSDRYVASSLAYQSGAVPMALVEALNDSFPEPDLTVYLDVPPEECIERIGRRAPGRPELFERLGTLRGIARRYDPVLEAVASRGSRVLRIDGTQPKDVVAAAVLEAALSLR